MRRFASLLLFVTLASVTSVEIFNFKAQNNRSDQDSESKEDSRGFEQLIRAKRWANPQVTSKLRTRINCNIYYTN